MNYPDDAKILALGTGMRALIAALYRANAFDPELFIAHLSRGREELEKSGEIVAANAMTDFFDPIVAALRKTSQQEENSPK